MNDRSLVKWVNRFGIPFREPLKLAHHLLSHNPHETHVSVSADTCNYGMRAAAPSFSPTIMNGAIQQMQWHMARRPKNRLGTKNSATMIRLVMKLCLHYPAYKPPPKDL